MYGSKSTKSGQTSTLGPSPVTGSTLPSSLYKHTRIPGVSPSQVNQVLLDAGQRHFHISRPSSLTPPWQDAQHFGTIRDMWTQYKLAQRQFQYCASGLRACFRSWRCHTRFQAMHRTVRRNSRLLRRRRFDELLHQAEAKDYHGRVDCLFALLRQHAPKQPRVRAQLRSSSGARLTSGALLMPQAEARELADYWKGVTKAASPTCAPQATDFDLDVNEVVGAIQQLPANKAAPAHYAPHALWKIVAEPVGQLLDRSLLQEWREHQADIPADWADAWLTFLQKAHKAGNKPEHLRPIALLDPVGKVVSGILRQQLDPTSGRIWRNRISTASSHLGPLSKLSVRSSCIANRFVLVAKH